MKHLKTCIAVSLDGFIATKDNELDWMPEKVKKEISVTYEQSGVLLAGVNTYTYIFEHWGGWPYKSKKNFCSVPLRYQCVGKGECNLFYRYAFTCGQ